MTITPAYSQGLPEAPMLIDESNAEHYIWGDKNDGWHLLKRDDISIIRERMVPGGKEVPHAHKMSRQFFQVLSGVLSMRTVSGTTTIQSGQGLEIAPGIVHQAINQSQQPVEFIVVSFPPSHGDRIDSAFSTP